MNHVFDALEGGVEGAGDGQVRDGDERDEVVLVQGGEGGVGEEGSGLGLGAYGETDGVRAGEEGMEHFDADETGAAGQEDEVGFVGHGDGSPTAGV